MSFLFYLAWFPIRVATKLTDSAIRGYHHATIKKEGPKGEGRAP